MAFDQSTRGRLQKFVSNCREILREEFERQLQSLYGMDQRTGVVAQVDDLSHLDNRQRQTAQLLRETLTHYLATTPGKGEKDRTKQVLDRIVREQAFTVLNRLAALRMAEARGFLLESIAKAHSSKGFQLYRQLSGTAHGETGDAYRNYLFGVFDEFSLDLAVLFDRHSAQGRLFPRESALLELLAEINHHEIEHLWAEDETIGWIYQYFNSQEERKKMRAESQAPRNSRELAVRNQFFTPRYVVEFLTDNTLGRIWYEMTQGNTALVETCRYLVRRPFEIFLEPGEAAPEAEASDSEALSQEQLLNQPVYIPHRPLKDPRSIRMLDPACGSMHFGLYAFDIFERIYREAWQLEHKLGADEFIREPGQKSLRETFESLETFQQQIPKLIIEHNIYGVDIDPRAVQIAGLSLWHRAQRAWYDQEIKPQQRPVITKSNIVCAEPMPGEKELLQEFTRKLNPPVLRQLLEVIFDKMRLAGEAGALLKIEEEIKFSIHEAREQWLSQSVGNIVDDMFQTELDAATPQTTLGFDLRGIDDESFWDDAEQRILQALSDYADQSDAHTDHKRLFAEDTAKGFAFIDLCQKRFDVMLMNPPFGEPSINTREYLYEKYAFATTDILIAFLERGEEISDCVGALSNRTPFFLKTFKEWREINVIENKRLSLMADLGDGVLDAMVEASAYVLGSSKNPASVFFDARSTDQKSEEILGSIEHLNRELLQNLYIKPSEFFNTLPGKPIAYWAKSSEVEGRVELSESWGDVVRGPELFDLNADMRCWWEIPASQVGQTKRWAWYAKGGDFKRYSTDIHLLINHEKHYSGASVFRRPGDRNYYFLPGITYTQRTTSDISFRVLPAGCYTSPKGPAIIGRDEDANYALIAICNTKLVQELVNLRVGASGAAARSYDLGIIRELMVPSASKDNVFKFSDLGKSLVNLASSIDCFEETHPDFNPNLFLNFGSICEAYANYCDSINSASAEIVVLKSRVENLVSQQPAPETEYFASPMSRTDFQYAVISAIIGKIYGLWFGGESRLESCFSPRKGLHINYEVGAPGIFTSEILKERIYGFWGAEIEECLGSGNDLASTLSLPSKFFAYHLASYSRSRRQAPIYWPLQSSSGGITLWVCYHYLNEQTLYLCINDFLEPKIAQIKVDLDNLRSRKSRSSQEEKEFEKLNDLMGEFEDFRDELLRLAKIWKPDLNDGVLISAAPLWRLFQHKSWQKRLREAWEALKAGDYDWAHMALINWPARVLYKCHTNLSIAIAHGVKELFWEEVEVPVFRRGKDTGEIRFEWQPKDLSKAELDSLIRTVIEERGLQSEFQ